MFESASRLRRDVSEMLDALRELGESRYAAVFAVTGDDLYYTTSPEPGALQGGQGEIVVHAIHLAKP